MNSLLQKLNSAWSGLSRREQRLATIVGALILLFMAVSMARGAVDRISDLNSTIRNLQQDIVNYHGQIAKKKSVEAQYEKVAKQHSSKWTEPEIRDRLRSEIYRLAQIEPPELDENGIPRTATSEKGALVGIPSLQPGTLDAAGDGYRQYHLSFHIGDCKLEPLITFLERLMASPQSLSIDALDISRGDLNNMGVAKVDITRTVVAGVQDEGAAAGAGASPAASEESPRWTCDEGEVAILPGESEAKPRGYRAHAAKEGAQFYLLTPVTAGATYDLTLDAGASGKGQLAITDEGGATVFEGAEPLRTDGETYRYQLQFSVPGKAGQEVKLRVPSFMLESIDTTVTVYKLLLRERTL